MDISPCKEEAGTLKKRSKNAGGRNLRKSLAWNQAFFTEDGVLDQRELSFLTGTSTKPDKGVLHGLDMEASPLMGLHKGEGGHALESIGDKSCCISDAKQGRKYSEGWNSAYKSKASIQLEHHETAVSESIPPSSVKQLSKSALRSPALFSQKRVANTNAASQASKIPKFMSVKLHDASSLSTKTATSDPKSSKFAQSSGEQVLRARALPSYNTRLSSFALSLSESSTNDHCKALNPNIEKCMPEKVLHDLSSSRSVPETSMSCGSKGVSACIPRSFQNETVSVPLHAKPSGLRKPSPSLSFFGQGKPPASSVNHPQRTIQSSKFVASLRKPSGIYQSKAKLLPPSGHGNKQQDDAPKSFSDSATSDKELKSLICSSSLSPKSVSSLIKEQVLIMESDITNLNNPRSSNCQTNSQQPPKSSCLAMNENIHEHGRTDIVRNNGVSCESIEEQGLIMESSPIKEHALNMESSPIEEEIINMESDITNLSNSRSPNCLTNSQQSPESPCLAKNIHEQCHEWTDTDKNTGKSCKSNSMLKMEIKLPAETRPSEHCDDVGIPDNIQDTSETSKTFVGVEVRPPSFSCDIESPEQQHEYEFHDNLSGMEVPKHSPLVDRESMIFVSKQTEGLAEDTNQCFDAGSVLLATNERSSSSPEVQLSLILSDRLMPPAGLTSSSEFHNVSETGTTMPVKTASVGFTGISSGDSELTASIDNLGQDCTLQLATESLNLEKDENIVPQNEQKEAARSDIVNLKDQLTAVPFSEEWLAAVEAFGEEILTKKTGAVQNSPPDKTEPEPSPWSPVKRKVLEIGPFDCTKHTKNTSCEDPDC